MHPDLKEVYDYLSDHIMLNGLMGYLANIRVEEGLYIKVYKDDETSMHGRWKMPLMTIYFSAPGTLTVKFILQSVDLIDKLNQNFAHITYGERNTVRIDLYSFDHFKELLKVLG